MLNGSDCTPESLVRASLSKEYTLGMSGAIPQPCLSHQRLHNLRSYVCPCQSCPRWPLFPSRSPFLHPTGLPSSGSVTSQHTQNHLPWSERALVINGGKPPVLPACPSRPALYPLLPWIGGLLLQFPIENV